MMTLAVTNNDPGGGTPPTSKCRTCGCIPLTRRNQSSGGGGEEEAPDAAGADREGGGNCAFSGGKAVLVSGRF